MTTTPQVPGAEEDAVHGQATGSPMTEYSDEWLIARAENSRALLAQMPPALQKNLVLASATLPALSEPAAAPAAGEPTVTEAMVTAYLQANDAYWKRTDELPQRIGKWRNGTVSEATSVSLRAALAAATPSVPQTHPVHPAVPSLGLHATLPSRIGALGVPPMMTLDGLLRFHSTCLIGFVNVEMRKRLGELFTLDDATALHALTDKFDDGFAEDVNNELVRTPEPISQEPTGSGS